MSVSLHTTLPKVPLIITMFDSILSAAIRRARPVASRLQGGLTTALTTRLSHTLFQQTVFHFVFSVRLPPQSEQHPSFQCSQETQFEASDKHSELPIEDSLGDKVAMLLT